MARKAQTIDLTGSDDEGDPKVLQSTPLGARAKSLGASRTTAFRPPAEGTRRTNEAERGDKQAETLKAVASGAEVTELFSDEEKTVTHSGHRGRDKPSSKDPKTATLSKPSRPRPISVLEGTPPKSTAFTGLKSNSVPKAALESRPTANGTPKTSSPTPQRVRPSPTPPLVVFRQPVGDAYVRRSVKPSELRPGTELAQTNSDVLRLGEEGDVPSKSQSPLTNERDGKHCLTNVAPSSRGRDGLIPSLENGNNLISDQVRDNVVTANAGAMKLGSLEIETRMNQSLHRDNHANRRESTLDSTEILGGQENQNSHLLPTPALTPAALGDQMDSSDELTGNASEVPLHFDDVERVVLKHQTALREHQEALVKSRLRDAQEQQRCSTGPSINKSRPSPFAELFPQKKMVVSSTRKETQQEIIMQTSIIPAKTAKKLVYTMLNVTSLIFNAQVVPKVRSIGRLGTSRDILARNVKTLTHMPWFPENEMATATKQQRINYAEITGRYNNGIEARAMQRRCRATAGMWQPEFQRLIQRLGIEFEDILYYMLHADGKGEPTTHTLLPDLEHLWDDGVADCPNCDSADCRSSDWKDIANLTRRPPTDRRLGMAGLLCDVFWRTLKISVWHFISETSFAREFQETCRKRLQDAEESKVDHLETFCYVCGQFSCPTHGAYVEDSASIDESVNNISNSALTKDALDQLSSDDDDDDDGDDDDGKSDASAQGEVVLDDPEHDLNVREHATLPLRWRPLQQHTCGVYCVDVEIPLELMLGLQQGRIISGASREELQDDQPPLFDDLNLCDNGLCFWETAQRRHGEFETRHKEFERIGHEAFFSDKADYELCCSLLPMALRARRGPCELALAIPSISCLEIFYFMICFTRFLPHMEVAPASTNLHKDKHAALDMSNDKHWEQRRNFVPCSHAGPCSSAACVCKEGKLSCESSCACSNGCSRRFKGCTCRDGKRKVCFEDARCECWASNRECNPALCGSCGVEEVLDPANIDYGGLGLCRNNRIQLAIPRRTVMGVSEVHGWGLYAGEDIAKSEYISEYKGELISILEGNRRGEVYHNLGLEYLFKLSEYQELDGSNFSNKSRFINNSSLAKNINVYSKKLICNGVTRIMLYTARDISAGEELFYDYGYDKLVRQNFKEKPDPKKTDSIKRSMLQSTLSATTGIGSPSSVAPSVAPSERTEPIIRLADDEPGFDEVDEDVVLPTSGAESEYEEPGNESDEFSSEDDIEEVDMETEAEASCDSDGPAPETTAVSSGLHRPTSRDGRDSSPRPEMRRRLFDLLDRPKESPRKHRLSITQPKLPPASKSDSNTPIIGRRTSRTQSEDLPVLGAGVPSKRVPPELRKRRISGKDKRFGGDAQRKAAATRKARLEAERKAAEQGKSVERAGKKRKRSRFESPPGEDSGSSQPIMLKFRRVQASPKARTTTSAMGRSTQPESDSDESSVSMSIDSAPASPNKGLTSSASQQSGSLSSPSSKRPQPSGFGWDGTRSTPHGSPHQ